MGIILEDIVEESDVLNEEKVIDKSSGYLNLNFVEPSSENIVHSFGVDVSKIEAVIEGVELRRTTSGGFVPKTFEPSSENIVHSFGVDVSKIEAGIERVELRRTTSGGFVPKTFEPSSENIVHSFGVDVSKIEAVIERVELRRTNSGGFVPKTFVHKIKETDHDRAIKKIMNQAYHKVMAQVSRELSKKHMDHYEKVASEMKKRK